MEINIRILMTKIGNHRGSLVIGSLVILSAAQDLALGKEMLRGVYPERSEWAQHDTTGFGR
jgi:hypothetical protein